MAGETIDELKIEVEADASSASGSIDELAKELDSLQGSLRSLNTSKFTKLQSSLEDISSITFDESLSGLSSISDLIKSMENLPSASKFTRLANGLSSLNKADVSNMENIVYWMDKLSQTLAEFNSSRAYNVNLNIGNQTATSEDVENTHGLAEALDTERASAENTSETMRQFGEDTDATTESINKSAQAAENASDSLGKVAEAENTINSDKAKDLGNEIKETSTKTKESSNSIIDFGKIVENAFSNVLNGIKNILVYMGKSGLGGLSNIFKTAGNAATTFGKKALTAAKNLGQVVANASPLGKIPAMFDKISSATDKLSSKLNRVIRLFTMMAMRSAFRSVMDELGTAFEHLALECDDVNQHYSALISSMQQLAHNIAAVAQPILNIFGPALNYLIGLLNTAITYVNQFLAALTGRTYTAAKYVPGDYAEGLEDAADAADDATEAQKRLNKQLQGFNELNNLTTSETSSSSGSSGTGTEGEYTEGYYEELPIEQDILDFVDKLKEAWENADFTEIGNILGEKLKDALENIPWDEIQESAQKLAHSLATLINGFIETEGLGETIGNTIGEAINTALIFADEFLTTVHWDSLGQFIADILNGAVDSIEWDLLGKTLGDAVYAWLETIYNVVTNFDWEKLGDNLAEAINTFVDRVNIALTTYDWVETGANFAKGLNSLISGVEWDDLGELLANSFNAVLHSISGAIAKFDFGELGTDIATAMNSAFALIDWSGIGTTIKNGINGAFEYVANWAGTFDWESFGKDLATSLNTALSGIDWDTAITAADSIGRGIAKALENVLTAETFENLGSTLAGALNTVFAGIYGFLDEQNWEDLAKNVAAGINEWLGKMDFEEIGNVIGKVLQSAFDFLSGLIGEGGIDWSKVKNALQELWKGICEEVDMSEVGPILVGALGVWLSGNLVSGVMSALGSGVSIAFGVALGEALAGGITTAGLGAVATALGSALAAVLIGASLAGIIAMVDWEGVGQAIEEKFSESINQLTSAIQFIIDPDNSELVIPDSFDQQAQDYFNAMNLRVEVKGYVEELIDNLDDDKKAVEIAGEIIKVAKANGLDTSNIKIDDLVGYVRELLAQNPDLTVEDVVAKIGEFIVGETTDNHFNVNGVIDNLEYSVDTSEFNPQLVGIISDLVDDVQNSDSKRVKSLTGEIAQLVFGDDLTNAEIKGVRAIVNELIANDMLTISNVLAYVDAYAKLIELQDNLDDKDKTIETIGEIVNLITGGNASDYVVDGLTGLIEELVASGADPVDIIAEIMDFMVENGVYAEADVEAQSIRSKDGITLAGVDVEGNIVSLSYDDQIKLEGYLTELIDGIPDNDRYVEVLGEIYKLITGQEASDTVIEGLTAIVEKLEQKGQLTLDNVTAAVQAYGELVSLQDNLDDKDKVVDAAAKIIQMFTGEEASASQLDGVTAIITEILGNGGTIEDCIAEIIGFLNEDDLALDTRANITKLDYDMTQSSLEVEGEMTVTAIDIPNSLKNVDGVTATITDLAKKGNLSVDEVSATVAQLYKEGSLSLADITAIIDNLTKNGTLSLSDVNAIISTLSKNGTLSVSDVSAVISSLTKNGTLTVSDVGAYISSLTKSGSLSISDVGAVISSLTKSGALSVSDVSAVITSLAKSGTLSLSDVQAVISSLSKSGALSLSDIQAIVSSLSKNGTLSVSDISASVSSLSKSGSPSLASIAATVSSVSKSGSPSLASIAATINSVSKSGSPSLSSIAATVSSVSKSGSPSLAKIAATVSSASPVSGAKLEKIKATVSSVSAATTTPTLKKINATIKSGGLKMAGTGTALKNITATVKSATVSNTKNALLKNVKATVSSAQARSGMYVTGVGAKITSLRNNGASLSLSGYAKSSGRKWSVTMRRRGGIFSGGNWLDIPQYADGELQAGSMFIAGEAGPELVGHIGGQTEVLNASQLAAVMRNAIVAGISTLSTYLTSLYRHMTVCANGIIGAIAVNYDTPITAPDVTTYNSFSSKSEVLDQHEADMDEVLSLLEQIEDNTEYHEDIASDPNGMFKLMRKKNNEYRSATGKSAFA